jgi:hypothetical protein
MKRMPKVRVCPSPQTRGPGFGNRASRKSVSLVVGLWLTSLRDEKNESRNQIRPEP